MQSVYREARGFFGWVFLIIFLAFNAFMAFATWRMWAMTSAADAVVTGVLGTGIILFVWACGSVITGLLALVTRGRRIY